MSTGVIACAAATSCYSQVGYRIRNCEMCDCEIWLSSGGQYLFEKFTVQGHTVVLACVSCTPLAVALIDATEKS